jgi:hypothetical protein
LRINPWAAEGGEHKNFLSKLQKPSKIPKYFVIVLVLVAMYGSE